MQRIKVERKCMVCDGRKKVQSPHALAKEQARKLGIKYEAETTQPDWINCPRCGASGWVPDGYITLPLTDGDWHGPVEALARAIVGLAEKVGVGVSVDVSDMAGG